MSPIEIIAVLFGLTCVVLTVKQHILCWPTGLVMTALYVYIFFGAKLYSDMGLQVVYIFLQIYGWWHWIAGAGEGEKQIHVTRVSPRGAIGWAVFGLVCIAILGTGMDQLTDAALAYPDATTTVFSLIAQWWMARKLLESWLVWIGVDVLSIGIYYTKELYLTAGLYAVFLCLATAGYFAWRKSQLAEA